MRCRSFVVAALAPLALAFPASADPAESTALTLGDSSEVFPTSLPLPDGFQPEGIAIGVRPIAYFGSRTDGSIFQVDLLNGRGKILSVGSGPASPSLGLKVDFRDRLFVAGGGGGDGRVIDTNTGKVLAHYQFAAGGSFVNDVVLARDGAWFTDSNIQVLYKLPIGHRGELPAPDAFETVPLTGDIVFAAGTNSNGIALTPDGQSLIIVQSNTGKLFKVDPDTGVTQAIDLHGESVPAGDGLFLVGRTLFVMQNRLNQLAEIRLDLAATAGTLVKRLSDPRFDVPTTIAQFGNRFYLPNARFTTPPTPTTPYSAVAIEPF